MALVKRQESLERAIANTRRYTNFFLRLLLCCCFLGLGIFLYIVYPRLDVVGEQVRVILPGSSSVKNWQADPLSLDCPTRDLKASKLSELNRTLVSYASIDASDAGEKRRIKMLQDGSNDPESRSMLRGGRSNSNGLLRPRNTYSKDHYVDIGVRQSRPRGRRPHESWLLQLQSPRYDSSWPRFHSLLEPWAQKKRYDPPGMEELVEAIKLPVDKFFNKTSSNGQQGQQLKDSKVKRYRTCAVVGNSGILLNRSFGPFIDSHDAVIRLNNARIKTFEDSVGSKTTISFVNSNVYHICSRRTNCFCHPYGQVPIVMYICQAQHLMDIAYCERHFSAPVLVIDPRVDVLCARLVKWYSVKNYVSTTKNPVWKWAKDFSAVDFHYSSGFQAVVLALGICETVDILGFGKDPNAKHHYHTNQKAELALHDYAAEYLFYDDLVANRTPFIPFWNEANIEVPVVTVYR